MEKVRKNTVFLELEAFDRTEHVLQHGSGALTHEAHAAEDHG